jgi:lysozyme family protein
MSTNFELAVANVLEHEGGLVNNIHDPGGATNYGISLRWLEKIDLADADIDRDGDVDADDIKKMTRAEAKKFYRKYWWQKYKYDKIEQAGVAIKIMDMSVNMGGKQAHKLVQRALRAVGAEVKDDGVLGPLTFGAINTATPTFFIPALRCTQAGFYYALVMRNAALRKAKCKKPNGKLYEDFSVFLKGWLRRAYS